MNPVGYMPLSTDKIQQILPALTPDLVVAGRPGSVWRVEQLSSSLARYLSLQNSGANHQDLQALARKMTPDLVPLADEVARQQAVLSNIHFRSATDRSRRVIAGEVHPYGLSEDFSNQRVAFYFQEVSQSDREPVLVRHGLVGASPALREVLRKIERYAPTDAAVVVTGETGAGKELVAAALHQASRRSSQPFVALNCSAMSEDLLESELFGHEKGAFTGAVRTHKGRFERADGGTLFLDEIGDMPLQTQTRLLRVLETGMIERVGAEQELPVDVRIVAATHVPLEQAVGSGRFRADLYHRLSVLRIHVPPLRERKDDIAPLVDYFLERFNRQYGKPVSRLTSEAMELLEAYLWPGNVRELRNVLERVYIENESEVIGARAFAEWVRERQDFSPGEWGQHVSQRTLIPPFPLNSEQKRLTSDRRDLLEAELVSSVSGSARNTRPANLSREQIREAYRLASGNLAAAARRLGVHRATLYRYLKKLGIDRDSLDS
jgi:two-component system, NtrC family, response regulator HydG